MPTAPPDLPLYGADAQGLICGYRFRPGLPAQPIADAHEALASPDGDGFVWLHFNLGHAGTEPWLRQHLALGESFFEALGEGSRSTRIERDGERLFAVVNDVTFDFSYDPADIATLWISVQRGLVVSARRHPLRAIDRLRTAVKRGEALAGSIELLNHLLADQADELQRILRRAAERVDDIEDELLAGRHERHTAELARLRRLSVRLQRLLAPEPAALQRTLSAPPGWLSADERQRLHHAGDEFALVQRDIAALQERIKLMQDESAARVAEQNNRSLFTLTMVTVLALPINLVSGLFGMNVGGVPLAQHELGFWIMLALIAGATGLIAWLALRRLGPR